MSAPSLPTRAERVAQLEHLKNSLPGANPGSDPMQVAKLLADLGDLLRRSAAVKLKDGWARPMLKGIPVAMLQRAGLAMVNAESTRTFTQAADEAMESFLTEEPAEQQEWRNSAAQALLLRDRLQSVHRVIEELAADSDELVATAMALENELKLLDRVIRPKLRSFIALNDWRREELATLDDAERPRAFWFSARVNCDDLLRAFSGEAKDSKHLGSCSDCRADLERARFITPHVTPEIAFEIDTGILSDEVVERYRAHGKVCPPCQHVLDAMDAGDRAIEEWEAEALQPSGKAARRRDEEVLEDARDFRVLLRRREGRVKLLLAPRDGVYLSSATLVTRTKKNPLAAHATSAGLEFDLGAEGELDGEKVTLRFKTSASMLEKTYLL